MSKESKIMEMNKNADYGNWVSSAMMKMLWIATLAIWIISALLLIFLRTKIPGIIVLLIASAALAMTIYMQRCRILFDFNGGKVMGAIHQFLVDHFPWEKDREGNLIDIGCGAAALTNRVAKTHPNIRITGIDYWGAEWSYAKEQCEKNAAAEGVSDRVTFQKGDAAKLDFDDETFDGAVSNFVFHEVRTAQDKRDVVREALRVVRKGGSFAFQDMFGQKALYGDMNEFIEELKSSGIVSEIHYIPNIEKQDFVPAFVTAPWMIKDAGLIYGIK